MKTKDNIKQAARKRYNQLRRRLVASAHLVSYPWNSLDTLDISPASLYKQWLMQIVEKGDTYDIVAPPLLKDNDDDDDEFIIGGGGHLGVQELPIQVLVDLLMMVRKPQMMVKQKPMMAIMIKKS